MNETPNTSGASNASDFQPPTQNPQTASPNIQSTTQGLQPVEGNSLGGLDQLPARPLTVETARSDTSSPVSQDTSGSGISFTGLLPFIVAVLIAIWLFRRWNLFKPEPTSVPAMIAPEPVTVSTPVSTTKKPSKKTSNKTPKSKTKARKKSKKK